jgi:hypothetical protein
LRRDPERRRRNGMVAAYVARSWPAGVVVTS